MIAMARLAAKHKTENISRYIQNYRINRCSAEGQKALVEIARIGSENRRFFHC